MKYKLFGKTGLKVSELCLGTMTFGEEWGWGASKQESHKIFEAFAEAGGNFIDTANCYTNGTSEKFVGEFTRHERERFVIATKYSQSMRPGDPNACGNHRKNLTESLEASLKRLGTDYIDVYWVHFWDFMTPVEEVMRALEDAVRSGKILYAGISDAPAWIVAQSNTLTALRGWTGFAGLQIEYSLMERTPERELLPMARAFELAVTAWGTLGSGVLTGKYKEEPSLKEKPRLETGAGDFRGQINSKNLGLADRVAAVSRELGRSPSQVAINWVRQQGNLFIPILGARTAAQMKENLGCLAFRLPAEPMDDLEEASRVELGFPHDFLANNLIRDFVYGGTLPSVENHRS